MFSIFKANPTKKLNKQLDIKLELAMQAQRNGDIKSYALLTFEADEIQKKINELEAQNTKT